MKRILLFLLCVTTVLSLSSCVKEESEESLEMPEFPSVVTYTVSDTEYIRLLYNAELSYYDGLGEWIKDGEITRICYKIDYKYWGLLFSRAGITDIIIQLYRIDGITAVLNSANQIVPAPTYPSDLIGRFDEGLLNSSAFFYYDHDANQYEAEPSIAIKNISLESTDSINFDWTSDEWRQFHLTATTSILMANEIDLWYSFADEYGEWTTNGVIIPIRIELADFAPALLIYDVSKENEEKILFGSGSLTDDSMLYLDTLSTSMFYGDTVQALTFRIDSSLLPLPETEEPVTEPLTEPATKPIPDTQ